MEPGDAKLKSFIPPYARYCRHTMESFGEGTYARLAGRDHFVSWLAHHKLIDAKVVHRVRHCIQ